MAGSSRGQCALQRHRKASGVIPRAGYLPSRVEMYRLVSNRDPGGKIATYRLVVLDFFHLPTSSHLAAASRRESSCCFRVIGGVRLGGTKETVPGISLWKMSTKSCSISLVQRKLVHSPYLCSPDTAMPGDPTRLCENGLLSKS